MICSEREKFPFDIQHRSVLKYTPGSPSDFEALTAGIAERLGAALQRADRIRDLVNLNAEVTTDGLRPYEVAALAAVAAQTLGPNAGASGPDVGQSMEKAGFNATATALALRSLMAMQLLETIEVDEEDWQNRWTWTGYALTDKGILWLRDHESMVELKAGPVSVPMANQEPVLEDDIPF
jgi:hypothetical protein